MRIFLLLVYRSIGVGLWTRRISHGHCFNRTQSYVIIQGMYSHLIISSDKQQREKYALHICSEENIDPLDITIIETEQKLGIADVRNMQKKLFLKPLRGEKKAIILYDSHTASIETQNALLKVLEEPPAHTIIILAAANENIFLPTVLSRCKIMKLDKTNEEFPLDELTKYTNILVY